MSNNQWHIKEIDKGQVQAIEQEFNLPYPIARIMALRGISTREVSSHFFKPLKSHMHNPFLMKDMDKAVERIIKQKEKGGKVLIYGDYDVDGVSSTSLLYLFLSEIGLEVSYYIPHRDIDGYGLSNRGVDFANQIGGSLIITCDCGINAFNQINYSNSIGIDVIVTDHHKPEESIPKCIAVVNPNRSDCEYPFKGLCGAGVAMKLCFAIAEKLSLDVESVWRYADLVTLGTAADIVPLVDENRIISHVGLKQIRDGGNIGIRALIGTSKIKIESIGIGQITYWVTPKINAAGRLGEASRAVKLLTSKNPYNALEIAQTLHKENENRKLITQMMEQESISMVDNNLDISSKKSIVLYKEGWSSGIIGIVASRIKELYNRPTIIISIEDGIGKGSCRSIPKLDMVDALKTCEDLLDGFGGHPMAAGLSINSSNLKDFIEKFERSCSLNLNNDDLVSTIFIDCEINLSDINSRMINFIKYLEPFGPKNSKPKFLSKKIFTDGIPKVIGKDQSTVKFNIKQKDSIFEAIGFRMIDEYEKLIKGNPLDIVYTISENHWNGKISLQLEINEIRYSNV
mgnify:CR=1 FL=1